MKVIKSKSSKTSEKIHWLMGGSPKSSPDRVLVVYGEENASIYYEGPQSVSKSHRPS